MTIYLKNAITTILLQAKSNEALLKQSALNDDSTIDKDEKKIIEKFKKINNNYIKELEKLLK